MEYTYHSYCAVTHHAPPHGNDALFVHGVTTQQKQTRFQCPTPKTNNQLVSAVDEQRTVYVAGPGVMTKRLNIGARTGDVLPKACCMPRDAGAA